MIRIVNPILHTKFLDTSAVRSVFLWWSNEVYADRYKAFLQFEKWSLTPQGIKPEFGTIWKYPCFHSAFRDMSLVVHQVPRIQQQTRILRYSVEPRVQVIGAAPPSVSAAFAALNGLLPKKPL
jgi:hypothetical protein